LCQSYYSEFKIQPAIRYIAKGSLETTAITASMIIIEPSSLGFRDVRPNQAYSNSLCITNPLQAPVQFNLRPSSTRFTVSPSKVNLMAGQSIVVTVKLFLTNYPNFNGNSDGFEEFILLKSAFFEQKIGLMFYLRDRDIRANTIRSVSPARRETAGHIDSISQDVISELRCCLRRKDEEIKHLEAVNAELGSKHPAIQEIVRSRVEQERTQFEERSEKVI
jgi:hypothetical protein